jgi:hypothetical protein
MLRFYVREIQYCGMRWACTLLVVAAILLLSAPAAADVSLTINASPQQAHIGDIVTINGTVKGSPTIAVYLFVTGPELDPRGVTLDNLNIPTGHGLFTTAPVHLSDGSWTYSWDTSVILGTLKPGTYTLYVLDTPVDRLRFVRADYATTEIEFLPSDNPATDTPLDPMLPVLAVGLTVAGICCAGTLLNRKNGG